MKFILCILGVAIALFAENASTKEECSEHQEWVECKNYCQPSCDDPMKTPCPTFDCVPGCDCKSHLLLNEATGECIPPQLCPKPPSCTKINEEFTTCGSYCPPTCQTPCRKPVYCPAVCVEKCDCKQGYIRNELTGRCGLSQECPRCKHHNPRCN